MQSLSVRQLSQLALQQRDHGGRPEPAPPRQRALSVGRRDGAQLAGPAPVARRLGTPLPSEGGCVYLDYAATCPIYPEVADAMVPFLYDHWGNPSSGHAYGAPCRSAVAEARGSVARLLGCASEEVAFCSCGSEADNWAILASLGGKRRHVVVSAPGETALVSVMLANNEVGSVMDVAAISAAVKARDAGILVHTDAAQAVGKIDVNAKRLGVDYLTLRCNFIEPPTDVATLKSPVIPASATPFSEAGDDASRAERYDEVGDDASRAERYDDASHSASDAESYDVESRSASEGSYDVHVSDADMDAVVGAYERARRDHDRTQRRERVAADLEASLTGSRLELIAARTKLATPKKKKKRAVIGTKPKRVMGLSPEDAPMAWFAAAAVEQLPQTLYRCAGKSGGIVRAGVEKTSGALLKLAFGMEVVVDGAAPRATDPQAALSEPVAGWTSAKILERVCVAAVAQSAQGAMAIRSRSAWASATAAERPPPPPPRFRRSMLEIAARLVALSDDLGAYAARDDAFHATGAHSRVFLDADGAISAPCARARRAAAAVLGAGRRLSLNAKCRFLRYADGDSVQPHVDPAWGACDPDA
ncbi:cysteine desulfurase [Aureococcus anophagefferens]|nr:cysteine desulfurase [Aureococcus anophagefferens]